MPFTIELNIYLVSRYPLLGERGGRLGLFNSDTNHARGGSGIGGNSWTDKWTEPSYSYFDMVQ